jgi:hypothetical protein
MSYSVCSFTHFNRRGNVQNDGGSDKIFNRAVKSCFDRGYETHSLYFSQGFQFSVDSRFVLTHFRNVLQQISNCRIISNTEKPRVTLIMSDDRINFTDFVKYQINSDDNRQ